MNEVSVPVAHNSPMLIFIFLIMCAVSVIVIGLILSKNKIMKIVSLFIIVLIGIGLIRVFPYTQNWNSGNDENIETVSIANGVSNLKFYNGYLCSFKNEEGHVERYTATWTQDKKEKNGTVQVIRNGFSCYVTLKAKD